MTTQTSFDLSGLIHAIESTNSGYQIALYAEHAQIQIIDRHQSEQAPRIVSDRPAIARSSFPARARKRFSTNGITSSTRLCG